MPLEPPVGEFNLSRLERVISGPRKIDALENELNRRGLQRAVIVTGKTLGSSPLLARVTRALGLRCAAVFTGARQHVPLSAVRALLAEIGRVNADCLVSFGGGSPIDAAKVATYVCLTGNHPIPAQADGAPPFPIRDIVHIAVPTTLSAGEYTAVAGVTDETTKVKEGVGDPRIAAKTVLNDPTLALDTPDWLWVATGMRALDHAIESIYSTRHHLMSDTLSAKAIGLLVAHLAPSIQTRGAEQLAHRGYCQLASWFSIFGALNTGFGLSHALGHQIGPRWDVPHGVTSCITLPHVMRFMAHRAPQHFGPIAEGFGIEFDQENPTPVALECAERAAEFIAQFEVPHTLHDAGVPKNEIAEIAGTVEHHFNRVKNIERPVTQPEILSLLEESY